MTVFLAFLAAALLFASSAVADEEALQDRVRQLEEQVQALSGQQSTQLEQTIEQYLDESSAWQAAAAGQGVEGVTISADFLGNVQATVGLNPNEAHAVTGLVNLNFDMKVTENLDLHIYLTANTADPIRNLDVAAGWEYNDQISLEANGGRPLFTAILIPTPGFPTFLPGGSATLSGLADGIGVDGTQPTAPGSITVYEAFITLKYPLGNSTLYTEMGSMDPRSRFLQNAFADDEKTQFVNNVFDDPPSMLWLTDASGRQVIGFHQWINFGDREQYTINWGWFNTGGDWFNHGQFLVQFSWAGEVSGREMNVRLMGFLDEFWVDTLTADGDGSTGGGASWDWLVSDKIGVWFRITTSSGDVNPVELDGEVGVQFHNFIESRPDDVIGFAFGYIKANDSVFNPPDDAEMIVEMYYRYVREDGKLQMSPYFQYIADPGGGETVFGDSALFILGFRIYVPF